MDARLDTASVDENGWQDNGTTSGTSAGKYINWLTFKVNRVTMNGHLCYLCLITCF